MEPTALIICVSHQHVRYTKLVSSTSDEYLYSCRNNTNSDDDNVGDNDNNDAD